MPKPLEKGEAARYEYNEVRYAHVDVGPADAIVLTADPWSFLHAHLSDRITHSYSTKRECFRRALYYASLAEGFYDAAEPAELPTKGTLCYYGMLNLTKCFISSREIELEKRQEYHGLTLASDSPQAVQVQRTPRSAVFIFHEFAKLMGAPVKAKQVVTLKDVCRHIPELHEITFNLGHLDGGKRKYLPVDIRFLVNEKKDHLFTEMAYEKKHETSMPTQRCMSGPRESYFKDGPARDGWVVFRSRKRKRLTAGNWPRVYANILKEYRRFDLASILTRAGYRYYCDLDPGEYHHLCYCLIMMFYIGAVARYRPTEVQQILSGSLRPLITEAVALCPVQFLYQLVSLTTCKICVVPYAKL